MKNKEMLLWSAGIGAAILWVVGKIGSFHKLVKNQVIRGNDAHGSGAFGASRLHDGDHNGLDIVATPGEEVYSPVDGEIVRYSYPYGQSAGFSGYHIKTDKYLIKLWYLAPNQTPGTKVRRGQPIGFAQRLDVRYPGITNHVHIEVWDLTKTNVAINPATLF